MPHYPVLQPDGRLAVWSTIVDNFTAFDCTQAEAVSILQQWHTGDLAVVTAKVATGGIPFDHWHDWADCVAWAQFMHGAEDGTVKEALARTTDHMAHRYIAQHVATCVAETAADDLRAALAAATQRAETAERESDAYYQALSQYENWFAEHPTGHGLPAALALLATTALAQQSEVA